MIHVNNGPCPRDNVGDTEQWPRTKLKGFDSGLNQESATFFPWRLLWRRLKGTKVQGKREPALHNAGKRSLFMENALKALMMQ